MSLTFDLNLQGVNESDLDAGGRVLPGKYHVHIHDVTDDPKSSTPVILFKMLVLAGTRPDQVGLTHLERLYMTEKNRNRQATFARRLGLIGSDQFGKHTRVDWAQARGRQAVVEVVEEDFVKKDGSKSKSSKLSFAGIWPVDDERVRDVPQDAARAPISPFPKPPAAAVDDFADI